MTEEEAKGKWCPLVRVNVFTMDTNENVPANRLSQGPVAKGSNCIGSGCMAWRWHSPLKADRGNGYCGAFGEP